VFDRIKVKVQTSDTFPMELVCQLLITTEDMETYNKILADQNLKQKELEGMLPSAIDFTVD